MLMTSFLEHYQPLSKASENHLHEWNTLLEQNLRVPGSNENRFDFGIACSFGYMIPDPIIDYFSQGNIRSKSHE